MMHKRLLAVLGAGNMGTAVAKVLAENGHVVRIWNWEGDHTPLKQIERCGENKKYLAGFKLPKEVIPCYRIEDVLCGAEIVFFVVPSGVMEHTISFAARSVKHNAVLVDVSKGIEPHSLQLIPHVIAKHVRPSLRKNVVTISGPAIAWQMARRQYTAMNIASKNKNAMKQVIAAMANDYIKLVPTSDVIGVEVGGSFKNVYAIAAGMCDGMGLGLNTKAALLTRALGEIAELMKAMGGKKHTAYELAGVGDLIGTSLCPDSRNRKLGEYLGKGLTSGQALKRVKQTVEGVSAAHCLLRLARRHGVHAPFAETIVRCLEARKEPDREFSRFLQLSTW